MRYNTTGEISSDFQKTSLAGGGQSTRDCSREKFQDRSRQLLDLQGFHSAVRAKIISTTRLHSSYYERLLSQVGLIVHLASLSVRVELPGLNSGLGSPGRRKEVALGHLAGVLGPLYPEVFGLSSRPLSENHNLAEHCPEHLGFMKRQILSSFVVMVHVHAHTHTNTLLVMAHAHSHSHTVTHSYV